MYRLVRTAPTPAPVRNTDVPVAARQAPTLLRHVDISEAAVLADLLLDPETRTG
jgi:hypothetical protein